MLKKLPYPVTGLMLALASLGNLVLQYGATYRYTLGALAGLIFIAVIAKTIAHPRELDSALQQMPIAAVPPPLSFVFCLLSYSAFRVRFQVASAKKTTVDPSRTITWVVASAVNAPYSNTTPNIR